MPWINQINMKGLDGIQGPVYVGTGCVFRRQALYGYNPPKGPKRPKMVTCDCCPCFGRKKRKHAMPEAAGDVGEFLELPRPDYHLFSSGVVSKIVERKWQLDCSSILQGWTATRRCSCPR